MDHVDRQHGGCSKRSSASMSVSSSNETSAKILFKVCDSRVAERKCVVASSYDDLLLVIKEKFQLNAECRVVLDEDDAEIDDNECFLRLPEFTKLKFLLPGKMTRSVIPNAEQNASETHLKEPSPAPVIKRSSNNHAFQTSIYSVGTTTTCSGVLTLFLKNLCGKTVTLQVNPSDTVRMFKEQIQAREGIPVQQQNLFCKGMSLGSDRYTLSDCGICNEQTVHLSQRPTAAGAFPISVSLQNGKVIQVWVAAADTIAVLKEEIRKEEATCIQSQVLIFRGVELEDERTISHYSIDTQSTVLLVQMVLNKDEAAFPIAIKTLAGKTITVSVRASDPVELLKEKIYSGENIHPRQIRLIHPDMKQQLENDKSLAHYHIHSDSILHLVLRMGGF